MSVVLLYGVIIILIVAFFKISVIVPEKQCYIVERLGKYTTSLDAGFHILVPFIDRVAYRRTLKEEAVDVPPQMCITSDNVQVEVDGVLYLTVFDPVRASYGIENYRFAVCQLAQTTMRSVIGKMELDKTFCGREAINDNIVKALDEASDDWGIKVTRYEIRDITPSQTILTAMESQMRAEREKRANILTSEGEKQARINISEGKQQEAINTALGQKQRKINVAEGKARSIEIISTATAQSVEAIAQALCEPGGATAMNIRLAERYIAQFNAILKKNSVSIYPKEIAGIASLVDIINSAKQKGRH